MASTNRRAQLFRTIGNTFLELASEEERLSIASTPVREPRLLTVNGAAARLGVGRSTMYRLMGTGTIPYVKQGKDRRIETQVIDRYILQLRRTSTPAPILVVPIEPRRPGRPKGKK